MYSEVLGVEIYVDGDLIRLRDPQTGKTYPLPVEGLLQLEIEQQQAQLERQRANELQAEVDRLKRLLEEKNRG